MPEKWADYLVSAVKYNDEETHIVQVREHVDEGDSVGGGKVVARETVVARLDAGTTYMTITKSADGKWQKGAEIEVVIINRVKYIKTVPDRTAKDNLGSLPRL